MRFILLLLFALVGIPAFADLGETKGDLIKRYGTPYGQPVDANLAGVNYLFFNDNGVNVAATMVDGTCLRMVFTRKYAEFFTNDQIQEILNDNKEGQAWTEDYYWEKKEGVWKAWKRKDGGRAECSPDYLFVIASGTFDNAMASKVASSSNKSLIRDPMVENLSKIPEPSGQDTGLGLNDGSPVLVLTARGAFINEGNDRDTLYLSPKPAIPFDQVLKALAALPRKAWPHGRHIWLWASDALDYPEWPRASDQEKVVADLKTAHVSFECFSTEPAGWSPDGTH